MSYNANKNALLFNYFLLLFSCSIAVAGKEVLLSSADWRELMNSRPIGFTNDVSFSESTEWLGLYRNNMTANLKWCNEKIEEKKRFFGKKITELPYKTLMDNIEYTWGAQYRQNGEKGLNLPDLIEALEMTFEFEKRLIDPKDEIIDIDKYRGLLALPGVVARLYWRAERNYWLGYYKKTYNIMNFFLLPENKEGFSRGAAHYYMGCLYDVNYTDIGCDNYIWSRQQAIENYIKVPQYPTCLTYTAYSYIFAARAAYDLQDYHSALALVSIDVPCIDNYISRPMRNYLAARACLMLHKYTNSILHLQEALKYDPKSDIHEIMRWIPYVKARKEELWNWCSTNSLTSADTYNAIVEALTNENSVVEYDDICSILTIDWPKSKDLPESVATNRVLNNHYFEDLRDGRYNTIMNAKKKDRRRK